MESLKRYAPWTPQQVESLNDYQASGVFHEFTCRGCRTPLIADTTGWTCARCGLTQDWCHVWMADGSWRTMFPAVPAGHLVAVNTKLRAALAEAANHLIEHNNEYHHRTPSEFIEKCQRLARGEG